MSRDTFRAVVTAAITHEGRVLIGQKEDDDTHPIGGEWHFLGGHVEHGERLEAAIEREVAEETGLAVEARSLVDATTIPSGDDGVRNMVQFLYHCIAENDAAEARDDLQAVRWVAPDDLLDALGAEETARVETREGRKAFVERLAV